MAQLLEYAWLIPLLPLLACLLIALTPLRRSGRASGALASALMAAALLLALGVALTVAQGIHLSADGAVLAQAERGELAGAAFQPPQPNIVRTFRWAPAGQSNITMGFLIDPPAAAMLVMVTLASLCIHVFSLGYMAAEPRQGRFFALVALFSAAMLLMVMASNLLLFFMAWEIMGLCSFLLIGFWYDREYADPRQITPRQAALKAFITTRVGDVLLMLGIIYLWMLAGSLDFGEGGGQIFDPLLLNGLAVTPSFFGASAATVIALLIFAGTVGKSAQFPLHVWLPDAMEGPTPVSALIHAATMVAAGVFLVLRTFPLFAVSGALPALAAVGALTALGAALVAAAQFDIKRILAYSTISQLGIMVAALGVGAWGAALFHLLTHAFFKALLFLGAGSVIHGVEPAVGHDVRASQDIRNMGGLRRAMPQTFGAYLVGALSLAGFPLLAGFWSKDEILAHALGGGEPLGLAVFVALALTSFLTAFYMTRQMVLVFGGEFRGGAPYVETNPSEPEPVAAADVADAAPADEPAAQVAAHGGQPHESPALMTAPLLVLATLAALAGFINTPLFHGLSEFLGQPPSEFSPLALATSLLATFGGIGAGLAVYRRAFASAQDRDPLEQRAPGLFRLLHDRLRLDGLYERTFGALADWLAETWEMFDQQVIDPLVMGVGRAAGWLGRLSFIADDALLNDGADLLAGGTRRSGDRARRIATGRAQDYLALALGGLVVLALLFLYAPR